LPAQTVSISTGDQGARQLRVIGQHVLEDLEEVRKKTKYALDRDSHAAVTVEPLQYDLFWWYEENEAKNFWQETAFTDAHKLVRDALTEANLVSHIARTEAKKAGGEVPEAD
jgi:hypothetical protein